MYEDPNEAWTKILIKLNKDKELSKLAQLKNSKKPKQLSQKVVKGYEDRHRDNRLISMMKKL